MAIILITGARGFIAGTLLNKLRSTSHTVIGTSRALDPHCRLFKCDLSEESEVRELFNFYNPDIIFHLAANPITDIKKTGIHRIWQDNVMSTKNLLSYAKEGSKFILASSATVYSNESLKKGACEEDIPLPASFYGFSKYVSERLVEDYSREKGLMGVSARLIATVGAGSTHGVVHDLYKKYKKSNEIEVIGKYPGSVKPFIHVSDVVRFFETLVDKTEKTPYYSVYNVCNQGAIAVQDICLSIKEVLRISKYDYNDKWTGASWVGDNLEVSLSGKKGREELGFIPKYNNLEAIEKTIQEYEENI